MQDSPAAPPKIPQSPASTTFMSTVAVRSAPLPALYQPPASAPKLPSRRPPQSRQQPPPPPPRALDSSSSPKSRNPQNRRIILQNQRGAANAGPRSQSAPMSTARAACRLSASRAARPISSPPRHTPDQPHRPRNLLRRHIPKSQYKSLPLLLPHIRRRQRPHPNLLLRRRRSNLNVIPLPIPGSAATNASPPAPPRFPPLPQTPSRYSPPAPSVARDRAPSSSGCAEQNAPHA